MLNMKLIIAVSSITHGNYNNRNNNVIKIRNYMSNSKIHLDTTIKFKSPVINHCILYNLIQCNF